jgi:hypothetical protein
MRYVIRFDPETRIMFVTWSGTVTLADHKAFFEELVRTPGFAERTGILHDCRAVDRIDVTFDSLNTVRHHYTETVRKTAAPAPAAMLVATQVQFGQMRQYVTRLDVEETTLITYADTAAKAHLGLPEDFVLPG